MRALPAFAALLLPLPLMAQEGTGRVITKSEIRVADPRRTHGRLRDVIWDMFERENMQSATPPRHPLTDIWLRTRPRGTEVPGLCRYDSVQVEVAPTTRRTRGPDTPVRAVGLTVEAYYHFEAAPTQLFRATADYQRSALDGDCRAIDTRSGHFFRAPDSEVANDGYVAFVALQNALRQDPSLPLECDLHRSDSQSCRDLILSFDASGIEEIERCEDQSQRHLCYRVRIYDRQIDVSVTGVVSPGPPPGRVVSARLASLIVMWHSRAD